MENHHFQWGYTTSYMGLYDPTRYWLDFSIMSAYQESSREIHGGFTGNCSRGGLNRGEPDDFHRLE